MISISKTILSIAVSVLFVAAGTIHGQEPATNSHQQILSSPRSRLSPCRVAGIKEEVLCGSLEVYENREARTGRKIGLNIVILPALASLQPDPLFIFAGGPGQAATDGAAGWAQIFAAVRKERDIVLVDQRGTGKSNRLACEFTDLNETIQALLGGDLPIEKLKECRAQLEQRADLRMYTTPIAMDDIDEVRAWLGYERINIYGGSYGSRSAQVYLSRHPRRVRTMTIRAILPQTHNLLFNQRDAQRSFDLLVDDCAKDAHCAKAFPNLRQDLQTVFERLEKSPVKVEVKLPGGNQATEVLMTRDVFAGALRRALLDSDAQSGIPAGFQKAVAGDFKNFGALFAQYQAIMKFISLGMNLSVMCPEDAASIRRGEMERATRGTFLGDRLVRSVMSVCQGWPRTPLPKSYHDAVRSDVPALIFSGALDPDAPPARGAEVARHLPNSLHVVLEGMSHTAFPACAQNLAAQLISSGSVKGLDTSCLKELRRPAFAIPQR